MQLLIFCKEKGEEFETTCVYINGAPFNLPSNSKSFNAERDGERVTEEEGEDNNHSNAPIVSVA